MLPARRAQQRLVLAGDRGSARQEPGLAPPGLALAFPPMWRTEKSEMPQKDGACVWQEESHRAALSPQCVPLLHSLGGTGEAQGGLCPPAGHTEFGAGDTRCTAPRVSAGAAPWWEGATGLAMPDLLLGWVVAIPSTIPAGSSAGGCVGHTAFGRAVTQPRLNAVGKVGPQAPARGDTAGDGFRCLFRDLCALLGTRCQAFPAGRTPGCPRCLAAHSTRGCPPWLPTVGAQFSCLLGSVSLGTGAGQMSRQPRRAGSVWSTEPLAQHGQHRFMPTACRQPCM